MLWGDKRVISVAGGKGGIGKSSFVANLGVALGAAGKRVVLIDADIGAANLHTMVGVSYPKTTLADFFNQPRSNLDDFIIDTPHANVRLLSSASDILAIASPNYEMNQRLFKAIQKLDTDIIIFDIAAGTHTRAIDFFSLAPIGIMIIEPLPTAMENAFLFIKNLLFRYLLRIFYRDPDMRRIIESKAGTQSGTVVHIDDMLTELAQKSPSEIARFQAFFDREKYRLCIVANSVRNKHQELVIEKFAKLVKRYLTLSPHILGNLPWEPSMDVAIGQRTPFIVKYPQSGYHQQLVAIIAKLAL